MLCCECFTFVKRRDFDWKINVSSMISFGTFTIESKQMKFGDKLILIVAT